MPTFGSLFAGIGGIDLGLERAGWEARWQVEIDDFAASVLARHWPDVPRHRDVREVGKHNLEPVDLIAGGFPCQDISVAGKGAGLDGERSGLWFEHLRIVQELRPTWVLAENVPALRTRGADTVLDGLAAAGYSCWPLVVGARHVGAPHRRDRVWIVAHAASSGRDAQPLRSASAPERHGCLATDATSAAGTGLDDALRAGRNVAVDADGGRGILADTSFEGLEGRRGLPIGAREEVAVPTGGGVDDDVAHGHGHGREGERCSGLLDGERSAQRHDADRRHRWPARPGEPQHDWEEPRTVESPLGGAAHGLSERLAGRHRRASLKALGNSVVPQVVEAIGRAIGGVM